MGGTPPWRLETPKGGAGYWSWKTLNALGLRASLSDEEPTLSREDRQASTSRLDEVFPSATAARPQVSELLIMIDGDLIGRVRADNAGRLSSTMRPAGLESPLGHSRFSDQHAALADHLST